MFPIHPVDMEYHLAAQENPVLKEIRSIIEHEGIPPALRGRDEACLRLCGDYGIDEDDDGEAREFLNQYSNGGSGYQDSDDLLDTAWQIAHEAYDPSVDESENNEKTTIANYRSLIETTYGVSFVSLDGAKPWDLLRIRMVHVGLEMAAAAFRDVARQIGLDWDDSTAFRRIIGNIELRLTKESNSEGAYANVFGPIITFYDNGYPYPDLLLHELGHVFNANAGLGDRDGSGSINETEHHPDTRQGMGKADPDKLRLFDVLGLTEEDRLLTDADLKGAYLTLRMQQSWDATTNEFTADAFLNWVYHRNTVGTIGFTDDAAGDDWRDFMNLNMRTWIRNAIVYSALRENSNLPFFLEHNRIRGFVGMARVREDYDEAIVRNETSTARGNASVVGTLTAGDEVAVIGQATGDINGVSGDWTAVIFNGTQRWMASFLLALPQNAPPSVEDEWLDFDGGFSRAKDWQLYFDLLRYLDTGAGNA